MQYTQKQLATSAQGAFRAALALLLTFGGLFARAEKDILPTTQLPSQQFFIENKGQWHADVLYLVRTGGLDAWITKAGVTYDFYATEKKQNAGIMRHERETEETRRYGQVVRVTNQNANASPAPVGKNKSSAYYNYFIGNDESKWASNVGLYAEAQIENVYNGIAQRWYFENNNLRYDYIVQPNADYKQIQLSIEGAKNFSVRGNDLIFTTRFGEVKQAELLVYQHINGTKKTINAQWQLQNGNASFVLGNYNPALPLVIDPLIYSTFIGNTGTEDMGYSIAVDGSGHAYITGYTNSVAYPTTAGAYDQSHNGVNDVVVSKLNPAGTALIYSTFIGGNSGEVGRSIALDNNGNAYITGYTNSSNFPTTAGAYDQSFNGGLYDVYVTKLNPAGTALVYSTFIGSGGEDYGFGIAVDGNGDAYITGRTQASNFPTTTGAYDQSYNGGYSDVIVCKLNSTGTALIYSTFIGGSTEDGSYGTVTIDSNGNAYITGYTDSGNFPVTAGAYDQTYNGGAYDVFVSKLNSTGTALIYSTFIGGSGNDMGRSIAVDGSSNVYVTGHTTSANYPTTVGAYDQSHNGSHDVFVTKLNPSGNALVYSTFIGGSSDDIGFSIAVDGNSNAYVAGRAQSAGFPVTTGAYGVTYNGNWDAFACRLNSTGTALLYSTFLGASGVEEIYGIALDGNNHVYSTGRTQSTGYPTTTGAYDVTHNGGDDVFVTKLALCVASSATISTTACGSYTSPSGSHVYTSTGIYQDTLVNATGCDSLLTIYLTVNSVPTVTASSNQTSVCVNGSISLSAQGASTYTWGGSATGSTYTTPAFTTTGNVTYSVALQGTDNNGCTGSATVLVNVLVDACETNTDTPIGVEELGVMNDELKIYPNPVNEILNIETHFSTSLEMTIYDVLGKVMKNETLKIENGAAQIHVSEIPKGIYFIRITESRSVTQFKLIKQ